MELFQLTPSQIASFLCIFVRIGGVMFTAPIFNSPRMPLQIRAGLSLLLAIVMQPLVAPVSTDALVSVPLFLLLIAREAIIGVIIGYVANLIFSTVEIAGEIQDTQSAFGFAGMVDMSVSRPTAVIGQFQTVLMWLIFLSVNGHHVLLRAVADSFTVVPLGTFALQSGAAMHFLHVVTNLLVVALRIAAPVIGAVLLTDLALGVLQRTAPQLNLIAVGFQVKIAMSVLVLGLALPFILGMQRDLVPLMDRMVHGFLVFCR